MTIKQLLKLPKLMLVGETDDAMLKTASEALNSLYKEKELLVYVSSNGGPSAPARGIYEIIRILAAQTTCYGLVAGPAESNGLNIMLAVPRQNRFATRYSTFLIHQVSAYEEIRFQGSPHAQEVMLELQRQAIGQTAFSQTWIEAALQRDTDISKAQLHELAQKGEIFDAKRAKELGLIADVIF